MTIYRQSKINSGKMANFIGTIKEKHKFGHYLNIITTHILYVPSLNPAPWISAIVHNFNHT